MATPKLDEATGPADVDKYRPGAMQSVRWHTKP
jgi:hypothetical protein